LVEPLTVKRDDSREYDFGHSALPKGHRLREHVLYKIKKDSIV